MGINNIGCTSNGEQAPYSHCVDTIEWNNRCARLTHQPGQSSLTFRSADRLGECGGWNDDRRGELGRASDECDNPSIVAVYTDKRPGIEGDPSH